MVFIIMNDSAVDFDYGVWKLTFQVAGEHHRFSNTFKIRPERDGGWSSGTRASYPES